MSQIQYMKEWLGEQIHAMECQFLFHKDGLGVQELGADYYELGKASSAENFLRGDNVTEVYEDGFYYGTLFGEYIRLKGVRSKLDGIDYNLED